MDEVKNLKHAHRDETDKLEDEIKKMRLEKNKEIDELKDKHRDELSEAVIDSEKKRFLAEQAHREHLQEAETERA